MITGKNNNQVHTIAGSIAQGLYLIILTGLVMAFHSCSNPMPANQSNHSYDKVLDSANHLVDKHNDEQAVKYIDSLTPTTRNLGILQKFYYYSIKYNYYFHTKSDYEHAMPYTDSMLKLFNKPETRQKYITQYDLAFYLKGDVYFNQNKYNQAYQYFYQAKLIADKGINDCTLSDFSYHIGMILYKQENYRLAATNFISSTKQKRSCDLTFGNFYRMQELLNNTGLCYSKVNETDSALFYFNKALKYIDDNAERFKERKEPLDVARGVIYGNKAKIYIQQNNFNVAKQLLKQSIGINLRKGNDIRDAELSEIKLARIYDRTNNADSLNKLLKVMRIQLDSVKSPDAEVDWNYLMANYFVQKNNLKKSLDYFFKYDVLKDSLNKTSKALKEADITQQIKQFEKDNEFKALKKNNEQQQFYLEIGAVFGLMIILIFFLIVRNWRKSRKNIRMLGSLNHQINDQNFSLENALQELKQSSQEKDRILRTVAHDLRNPIGGIASLAMVMACDGYSEDQMEMINLISETSKNSLELINEILEVTNNGNILLNKETVEINSLVNNSVELLRFRAAEKGQKITLKALDTPVDLFVSREKIWRVIGNLISNAIKFSPPGSEIAVKVVEKNNTIEILVKDSGIGIPDNLKDKVFHMFTEAKRPGTLGEKSFGLGLSISKQIIEAHGGKIWFESGKGLGTTFYVSLPKGL